ncbi:hypothetical protein FQN57_004650 [Myotisia sp. PD_48]|nr:hypothetical protein FQN57_004650 [Myotisia sp. PD_48]
METCKIYFVALAAIWMAFATSASPIKKCKPVSGTFVVDQQDLYPESSDWDPIHCKLYAGALYNSTVLVYDPITLEKKIISFPDVSGKPEYHVSGIDVDTRSGSVYIGTSSGTPFGSGGRNLTGPNHLVRYDTRSERVLWSADLAGFQEQVVKTTGKMVSGFQDQAEDLQGNSYMLASFGNAIARISRDGKDVSVFYAPGLNEAFPLGFGGIFSLRNTLVVSDNREQAFYVFDAKDKMGKPKIVKPEGSPKDYVFTCDGLIAPSKYKGTVALCANNRGVPAPGGIAVYQSKDSWATAQWKGLILNDDPAVVGGRATTTVEITGSIFINTIFGRSATNPRSSFPYVDITSKVQALLTS